MYRYTITFLYCRRREGGRGKGRGERGKEEGEGGGRRGKEEGKERK